jgi:hypothetical protein
LRGSGSGGAQFAPAPMLARKALAHSSRVATFAANGLADLLFCARYSLSLETGAPFLTRRLELNANMTETPVRTKHFTVLQLAEMWAIGPASK